MRVLFPFFLLLSTLIAGCSGPSDSHTSTFNSSAESPAFDLEVSQADVTNEYGILFRLRTSPNASLNFKYTEDWLVDSPGARCSMVLGPQGIGMFGAPGSGRITVYASDANRTPIVDRYALGPLAAHGFSLEGNMSARGEDTYLVFAFSHSADGATARVQFSAAAGSAQLVQTTKVPFACVPDLMSFRGGRLAISPTTTWGSGLESSFNVTNRGVGWVMVRSDAHAAYSIRSQNATVVAFNSTGMAASDSHQLLLREGNYTFEIQSIIGRPKASAALGIVDLPEAVTDTWDMNAIRN